MGTSLLLIHTMTVSVREVVPFINSYMYHIWCLIDTKAFSHKVLTIRVGANEETTRAVTDIQILSASRKEDVPAGFTRLP